MSIYFDRNQIVHQDESSFGKAFICRGLGLRNYSIDKILMLLEKGEQNKKFPKRVKVIKDIYLKKALKAGLDEPFVTAVLKIKNIKNKAMNQDIFKGVELEKLDAFLNSLPPESALRPVVLELIARRKIEEKWDAINIDLVDGSGKPINAKNLILNKHYEAVKILIESRLIYSIAGFQNTTKAGKNNHVIKIENNELKIKIKGKWKPVSWIEENLVWDKVESAFASKANKSERWNYLSPEGLMPIDRYYHHEETNVPDVNKELAVVEKLSLEELQAVLAQGKTFHKNGTDNHVAVLQIITNPRPAFKENELSHNLNKEMPVHCGIRLITEDGSVYSTGFGSTLEEDKYNDWYTHYCSSINGQPTNLDYEEFRTHSGRITTSISMTQEQSKKLLENLNRYRTETIRFNILRQNCMRLGIDCLATAGVTVDITNSIAVKIFRAIPSLTNLLGVRRLKNRAYKFTKSYTVLNITFKALDILTTIIISPALIAGNLLMNLVIFSCGASYHSPNKKEKSSDKDSTLEDFDNIHPFHVINPLGATIFDSTRLIVWQLEQQSTVASSYKEGSPSMQILPSNDEELMVKMRDQFDVV